MVAKWVTITHPDTGGVCKVHPDSLGMWAGKGWRVKSDVTAPLSEPPAHVLPTESWWETVSGPDEIE